MRLGTLLAAVVLTVCVLTEINCITNQEFFDLVKDYAEDLESFDLDDPAINDDDDDDNVIDLPGNADDELDMEYLLTKLDLTDVMQSIEKAPPKEPSSNLGWWWRRRRRRRRRRRWRNPCKCRGTHCSCCISHTFRVNLWFKKLRFRIGACVKVGYVRGDHVYFTITFNGHPVFHHEISLRRLPPLCFPIPKLPKFIRGCIEVYKINIWDKSMCLRVALVVNLKFKRFRLPFHIGCIKFHISDEVAGQDVKELLESMEATMENKLTGQIEEVSLADLPALYRQLQIETAQKYLEKGNELGKHQGLSLESEEMK